ncbi:MAG: hypothetical protein ACI84O_001396 [Myxococcota bacterium]|jgi:hypothetical protein
MFKISQLPGRLLATLKKKKVSLEKFSQSFLFFGALSALVLGTSTLPLPLWAQAVFSLGLALLLALTTVVYPKGKHSEVSIQQREKVLSEVESKIETLKFEKENTSFDVKKMEWVLEMNLARVDVTHSILVDYFIGKEPGVGADRERILWKSAKIEDRSHGDTRLSGQLETKYSSKIAINLKDALVRYSPEGRVVEYCLPELFQSGVSDIDSEWKIQHEMSYNHGMLGKIKGTMGDPHWRVKDKIDSSIWSELLAETTKDISSKRVVEPQIRQAIAREAEYRMKHFIESCLGYRAVLVDRNQIANEGTLGEFLLLNPSQGMLS